MKVICHYRPDKGSFVKEIPRMEKPKPSSLQYKQFYEDSLDEYDAHLAALPEHKAPWITPEQDGKECEVELRYCTCKIGEDCPTNKGKWLTPCLIAVPVPVEGVERKRCIPVMIKCPECNTVQGAMVERTIPFGTYIQHCVKCKYIIMESEWDEVKPFASPGPVKGTFLDVLQENYEAAKRLTDEDKVRPAQELLLETYEDLISIHKSLFAVPSKGDDVQGEWQLCPKCNGQGIVSKPPWLADDVTEWTSTASTHQCNVCNGNKIIQRPGHSASLASDAVRYTKWLRENWFWDGTVWRSCEDNRDNRTDETIVQEYQLFLTSKK